MEYALLVHEKPGAYDGLSDEERQAVFGEYWTLRDDPRVVAGAALHPVETVTTVRVHDGDTLVTDGPFADTKEVFAGWYVIEADDIDAAIEIASRCPAARFGGSVEVRPVLEPRL
jgi:hypothetical protein